MPTKPYADEVVDTDVLVIGGGLAGTMAAIRARKLGADTVVLEKSAIKTSGDAYAGMDQMSAVAHPKLNNLTAEQYFAKRMIGYEGLTNPDLAISIAKAFPKLLPELEEMGLLLREEDGEYKFMPGKFHGMYSEVPENVWKQPGDWILFRGADMKAKLAAEVIRQGAKVYDRTMLTGLMVADGSVVGATGYNIRTGKFTVFRAKSTILSAGGVHRLYWHPYGTSPNNLFTVFPNSMNCGDGTAAAYRAGAKLVNMEFVYAHTLSAGLPWGVSIWYFVTPTTSKGYGLLDKYANDPKVVEVPTERGLSQVNMMWQEKHDVMMYQTGDMDPQAQRYWEFMRANERPGGLKILQKRGGLTRAPFQARTWLCGTPRNLSGIVIDEGHRSSLPGLYAAGDIHGGIPLAGTGQALPGGATAAESAVGRANRMGQVYVDEEQVVQERQRVNAPLSQPDGVYPLDAEDVVRKIVWEYVGFEKSEAKLNRCVELLNEAQEHMMPQLGAANPHEVMRALEAMNILEVGRIHARAAVLRKESRLVPWHYRVDYPEKDDANWRRAIVVQKNGDQMDHNIEDPNWKWDWR